MYDQFGFYAPAFAAGIGFNLLNIAAVAPLVLGLLMQSFGANVLWISAALSVSAFAALYLMRLKA